jgi:hypothetical protein
MQPGQNRPDATPDLGDLVFPDAEHRIYLSVKEDVLTRMVRP